MERQHAPHWTEPVITVETLEAKPQLSALVDRVAAGEDILITRDGRPVARLTKAESAGRAAVDESIAKLLALRPGATIGSDWKTFRDEGRR